jgi:uncharacterized protein with PQ loop repeat
MKRELNFYLQWSATVITILGAVFTSMNIYPANVIAFNLGSVLWLIYAIRVKVSSLVAVNAGLLLIYVAGLIRAAS